MKKIISLVTALAVMLFASGALAETPARLMVDSLLSLLFETGNVTLTGHAEFSLDGERFKTADVRCVQDGADSLLEWKLLTPRADGSEREGGYTVIANGENVYVMEAFYPGVYKTGTTAESSSILRSSVRLNPLLDLLRILADQSEDLLGEGALESNFDETGRSLRLRAGEDVPELVNTALNLAVQFLGDRYFETDYDHLNERDMVPMERYITVTQAILGSTRHVSLKGAEVLLKQDAGGNFESAEGKASLQLDTENDGKRTLDISFRLDVSDRGSSHVGDFNPADYGVELAEGAMNLVSPERTSLDPETEKRLLEAAAARLALAGCEVDESMEGSVVIEGPQPSHADEWIHIDFSDVDGTGSWHLFTDSIGRLLGLQHMTNPWQSESAETHFEPYPDQALVKETEETLLSWLKDVNPELSADVLSLETDWWIQDGEEVYLHFWEGGEADHAWDEADFIVKVAPESRIECFSCISNG